MMHDESFNASDAPNAGKAPTTESLIQLDIGGDHGLHFRFPGRRPGLLHRIFQRVFLGFRWTVVD